MNFPELNFNKYRNTRDTIQAFTQLISEIKVSYTPHSKNWEEFALSIYAKGFTTSPIPIAIRDGVEALDLNINLQEHKLKIFFGKERLSVNLENQSVERFAKEVESLLNRIGINYILPFDKFNEKDAAEYNSNDAKNIWTAVRNIYFILQEFKSLQFHETSSINFWPHHFDLALLLFSGRIIPDKDTNDWANSREQINFGFSLGDAGINEPYLYVTVYPFNKELLKHELPQYAYWNTQGWNGAVLKYSDFRNATNPKEFILTFMNAVKNLSL
jgi:hypothetical protein